MRCNIRLRGIRVVRLSTAELSQSSSAVTAFIYTVCGVGCVELWGSLTQQVSNRQGGHPKNTVGISLQFPTSVKRDKQTPNPRTLILWPNIISTMTLFFVFFLAVTSKITTE